MKKAYYVFARIKKKVIHEATYDIETAINNFKWIHKKYPQIHINLEYKYDLCPSVKELKAWKDKNRIKIKLK